MANRTIYFPIVVFRYFSFLSLLCFQFVDLFITCLSVMGYYAHLPDGSTWNRSKVSLFSRFISLFFEYIRLSPSRSFQ